MVNSLSDEKIQTLLRARAAVAERDELRRARLARQLRSVNPELRRAAETRLNQWESERMLAEDVIDEWREILLLPRDEAVARACADSPRARLLRKSSPFMGLQA